MHNIFYSCLYPITSTHFISTHSNLNTKVYFVIIPLIFKITFTYLSCFLIYFLRNICMLPFFRRWNNGVKVFLLRRIFYIYYNVFGMDNSSCMHIWLPIAIPKENNIWGRKTRSNRCFGKHYRKSLFYQTVLFRS